MMSAYCRSKARMSTSSGSTTHDVMGPVNTNILSLHWVLNLCRVIGIFIDSVDCCVIIVMSSNDWLGGSLGGEDKV